MSNLINKTRLQKFATDFWAKIKDRYDNAFVGAEITASTETEKKIKFTKAGGGEKAEVNLQDYARLQDRNEFKQDVSVDDGATDTTLKCGTLNGNHNLNRVSGHRSVTTKAFVDGYIKHLIVLADETQNVGETSNWEIWAIKKGATRADDRVAEKIVKNNVVIKSMPINGTAQKVVELPIDKKFSNEVYFLVRCVGKNYKVINISTANQNDDCINLSNPPGNTENDTIEWGTNAKDNIAVIFLVGRESIKSLSEKLDKVNADGGLYVKQAEVSVTSEANKVVRLGADGKLDKNMLPSIAINKYFEITDFTNPALQNQTYENGDVAVVTGNGANRGKRYLCINKVEGQANSINDFIELNSKDGSVLSVNERTGAVELNLEATDDKFKLKISGTGGAEVVKEIPMISDAEITEILDTLQ